MPVIQHFVVTQTREVMVSANSIGDAVLIGAHAFEHGQNSDNGIRNPHALEPRGVTWGNTSGPIKDVELTVRKDGF